MQCLAELFHLFSSIRHTRTNAPSLFSACKEVSIQLIITEGISMEQNLSSRNVDQYDRRFLQNLEERS